MGNQCIDQGKASAQNILALQRADRAQPYGGGGDTGGDTIGGSELRQLFVKAPRLPYRALYDGDVAKADARAYGAAQPQRRGFANPRMRRQKGSAVAPR